MSDLDAILNGKEPAIETQPEETMVEEPVVDQKDDKIEEGEPSSSKTDKKAKELEDLKESKEKKVEEKPESWTKTAVIDERRKRQELEARYRELEERLNQMQRGSERQEEEIPDPVSDPKGYAEYVRNSISNDMYIERVTETRKSMLEEHEDYLEMENKFIELSNKDSNLAQQIRKVANPAKFAYETAKKFLDNEKYKDPNYLQTLEQEMEKRILAKLAGEQFKKSESSGSVLPDLSKTASSKNGDKFPEQKSLDDILPPIEKRKK